VGFLHTTFQSSTSAFCDVENRVKRSEHHWNPVALWRGQVVLLTAEEGAHCLSAASLRAAGVGDTAQGTRRATPWPPWFWVLLPKQKDLVHRGETRHLQKRHGYHSWLTALDCFITQFLTVWLLLSPMGRGLRTWSVAVAKPYTRHPEKRRTRCEPSGVSYALFFFALTDPCCPVP
jgi:hypothetical protein